MFIFQRLVVEFAVEDARIMRAREMKKRRSDSKRSVAGSKDNRDLREGGEVEGGAKRGTNKKVKWQLKCKEKRLRRRERREKTEGNICKPSNGPAPFEEDGMGGSQGQSAPETESRNRHKKRKLSQGTAEGNFDVCVVGPASDGMKKPSLNGRKRKAVSMESDNRLSGGEERGVVSEGETKRQRRSKVWSGGERQTKLSRRQSRRVCFVQCVCVCVCVCVRTPTHEYICACDLSLCLTGQKSRL